MNTAGKWTTEDMVAFELVRGCRSLVREIDRNREYLCDGGLRLAGFAKKGTLWADTEALHEADSIRRRAEDNARAAALLRVQMDLAKAYILGSLVPQGFDPGDTLAEFYDAIEVARIETAAALIDSVRAFADDAASN